MSLRGKWEFEYTAARLSIAAKEKAIHHTERLAWWEKEKEKVMDKVRDVGISVQESIADQYGKTTQGYGPQITVDATLQRELNECQSKITAHRDSLNQYNGWIQVFDAHPEYRLKLDHDDYLFFYGK